MLLTLSGLVRLGLFQFPLAVFDVGEHVGGQFVDLFVKLAVLLCVEIYLDSSLARGGQLLQLALDLGEFFLNLVGCVHPNWRQADLVLWLDCR